MASTSPQVELEQLRGQLQALRAAGPAGVVPDSVYETADRVRDAAANAKEAAASTAASVKQQGAALLERVTAPFNSAARSVSAGGQAVRRQGQAAAVQVRQHPLAAVGLAAGAGYLLGVAVLAAPRRPRSRRVLARLAPSRSLASARALPAVARRPSRAWQLFDWARDQEIVRAAAARAWAEAQRALAARVR